MKIGGEISDGAKLLSKNSASDDGNKGDKPTPSASNSTMQRTQTTASNAAKFNPSTIFLALGVGGAGLVLAPRVASVAARHFQGSRGFMTGLGSWWKRSGTTPTAARGFKSFYKGGFESEMTLSEAALILGIRRSASRDKIRLAHRRIMLANHPDNGGSDYLASKINEAKEVLLKDLPE